MKKADLYIRVSTDEQAEKGFSVKYQEDMLRRHCLINSIQVQNVYFEDFPARNFKRPTWSSLLVGYKTHKAHRPDYVLFTKWDRFSRNIAEAYLMIKKLQDINIIPQAIEQPLDISIPENKMVLAIYLVTPEVENDIRSLNVKEKMQKARAMGRWMGSAPIGYRNTQSATGEKYITIQEPEATLMREAFEQVSLGLFSIREIHRMSVKKGLVCSLNNFCQALRNPVYCGKIIIDRKQVIPQMASGKHAKIISQLLFDKVQNVLKNKSRMITNASKKIANEMLPFRGFLYCPLCFQKLTGSRSKGRTNWYFYYHCNCGFRIRTEKVHNSFISMIKSLKPNVEYNILFHSILRKNYKAFSFLTMINQHRTVKKIEELEDHMITARSLLLSKDIDAPEYYKLKKECQTKREMLKRKIDNSSISLKLWEGRLDAMSGTLSSLDYIYESASIDQKRRLITLLFRNPILWNENCFRNLLEDSVKTIYNHLIKTPITNEPNLIELDALSADYKLIIEIEQRRGVHHSASQIQHTLSFLYDLANFTVEFYNSQFILKNTNLPTYNYD
ncbi:recombinase family protein [Terrimonas sp.]|uniref:recombinase family protein n=1 Tax=Terrimonas sp. TaxID=1914338 RepID=UPI0014029AB0|nr:recombinase family protein [Terrimonas sp.]MBX2887404.1 recombinase family protein [Ferruginibacter sp.]